MIAGLVSGVVISVMNGVLLVGGKFGLAACIAVVICRKIFNS